MHNFLIKHCFLRTTHLNRRLLCTFRLFRQYRRYCILYFLHPQQFKPRIILVFFPCFPKFNNIVKIRVFTYYHNTYFLSGISSDKIPQIGTDMNVCGLLSCRYLLHFNFCTAVIGNITHINFFSMFGKENNNMVGFL